MIAAANEHIKTSERFKEIITILAKYGIADWLSNTKSEVIIKYLDNAVQKDITKFTKEQRIRLAISELGTTFIKFGQILSTRSEVIGQELADELSQLQSATPSDSYEQVEERIKSEFEIDSVLDLFMNFDKEPLASASIAQVHLAKLYTEENVVVKVMHSGIEKKVVEDLKILTYLGGIAQKHGGQLKAYQPLPLARQFSQTMMYELDFNKELNNINRFTDNFEGDDRVAYPTVFPEQSGKTVLTMSFLEGTPLSKVQETDLSQEQKTSFTEESADVFMEMMFRDKFYHADPHPGNLLVREDGSLGLLDFGMVNRLDQKSSSIFEEFIIGIANKDSEHIKNTILDMCTLPKGVDYDTLTYQIDEILDRFINLPLNEFDMSGAVQEITAIIQEHHIVLPPTISGLLRVVVLLEGSSRLLNPNFNIAVLFKKYHHKILKRRYAPKTVLMRLFKNINRWEHIMDSIPLALEKFMRKAGQEDFEINLEHRNLEKSVNSLVMGLITSALFVGSSLLWSFKVPPVFHGYSVVGVCGVIISGYLTFKLVRSINRNKENK